VYAHVANLSTSQKNSGTVFVKNYDNCSLWIANMRCWNEHNGNKIVRKAIIQMLIWNWYNRLRWFRGNSYLNSSTWGGRALNSWRGRQTIRSQENDRNHELPNLCMDFSSKILTRSLPNQNLRRCPKSWRKYLL
jgi:hypothetical protein